MESRFQSGEGHFEHTMAKRHYVLTMPNEDEPLLSKLTDDYRRDGVHVRFVASHSASHTEALLRQAKRDGQIEAFALERIDAP